MLVKTKIKEIQSDPIIFLKGDVCISLGTSTVFIVLSSHEETTKGIIIHGGVKRHMVGEDLHITTSKVKLFKGTLTMEFK